MPMLNHFYPMSFWRLDLEQTIAAEEMEQNESTETELPEYCATRQFTFIHQLST